MNSKTTPKDFFLHLAATVFLYAAVIALINLAFAVANRALPDVLQSFYGVSDVVWPISMLLVLVPVTYLIEWLINRDIAKMPEKREVWIRRWRIYLTLFLTAVTIIIDLIALINTFLNGEITSRFVYKVLIVFVVSGVVFAYYILARAGKKGVQKKWRTVLMWLGVFLTLAAIIGGFIIVGSPATQRAMRFDEQRINDLQSIIFQIANYAQSTGKLPDSLQATNDATSRFVVPVDPETHTPYEYSVTTATSYKLCATFNLSAADDHPVMNDYPMQGDISSWKHTFGHSCLEESIYPTRYVPNVPVPAKVM